MDSQNSYTNKWIISAAIAVILCLIYGRAYEAGFVTDFTGLHMKMQGQGLGAALHSFGFPSLMPLLNVTYWILDKLSGLQAWGWFLFAIVVSSLTLATFYRVVTHLLEDFGYEKQKRRFIALTTIALVITSPYQIEAMIWKVGLGHLMSVAFFILAFYQLVRHLSSGHKKPLVVSLVALMLSLFCFEWGLVFPAMAGVLIIGYWRIGQLTMSRGIKTWLWTLVPIAIYLLLTKLVLGSWLGHYDTETEMDLEVTTMFSTTLKYVLKHLSLTHFYPNDLKQVLYGAADKPVVLVLALLLLMLLLGLWMRKGKHHTLKAVSLCCGLLGLVLVAGLHFHNLLLSENDRYGSLFVYFLAFTIALIITDWPKWFWFSLVLYLTAQFFFQQKLVNQWAQSQSQIDKITTTFKDLNLRKTDKVLMLNLPENLRGTFMFRDFSGQNPLSDHLTMYGIEHPSLELVAQYNLPYQGQAYTGKWISEGRIRLEAREWGSWWWNKGLGLGKYETETYIFEPKSKAMEVQLKPGHQYNKLLYFDGERWQIL